MQQDPPATFCLILIFPGKQQCERAKQIGPNVHFSPSFLLAFSLKIINFFPLEISLRPLQNKINSKRSLFLMSKRRRRNGIRWKFKRRKPLLRTNKCSNICCLLPVPVRFSMVRWTGSSPQALLHFHREDKACIWPGDPCPIGNSDWPGQCHACEFEKQETPNPSPPCCHPGL